MSCKQQRENNIFLFFVLFPLGVNDFKALNLLGGFGIMGQAENINFWVEFCKSDIRKARTVSVQN
jgi:hypothetical protein